MTRLVNPRDPLVLDICGRTYELPRSFDMLSRAEAAIGAAYPFAQRLDARQVRSEDIVRLYAALLRGTPGAPTQTALQEWVFERGGRHSQLAVWLASLTLSCDELEAVVRAREMDAEDQRLGTEPPRGPFVPTEQPIGPTSLDWATALAGPRPSSGDPTTMN